MSLAITPHTKVGELLEAYPFLEPRLVAAAPAFEKLRNPMVRKTVAKVATLEQAARIGGVGVAELVGMLREAAGQTGPIVSESESGPESGPFAWLEKCRLAAEIDADEMLDQGVHPGGTVRQRLAKLKAGEAIRLRSSFLPEPLIEAMRQRGFAVHCKAESARNYVTYFGPAR